MSLRRLTTNGLGERTQKRTGPWIDPISPTSTGGHIDCLNRQDWSKLEMFVHRDVHHNGRLLGVAGYREMLERNFYEIPDLYFDIRLLVCEPPRIASRLLFNCTPKGEFLGLLVNGRKITFAENVFYEFHQEKIMRVWSVIDKGTIEAQIR